MQNQKVHMLPHTHTIYNGWLVNQFTEGGLYQLSSIEFETLGVEMATQRHYC